MCFFILKPHKISESTQGNMPEFEGKIIYIQLIKSLKYFKFKISPILIVANLDELGNATLTESEITEGMIKNYFIRNTFSY